VSPPNVCHVAHDENALTNLLFSEIHRHEVLPAFLGTITWRNRATFPFTIREATLHQQVGFSEFGKPDALIVIVDTDEEQVAEHGDISRVVDSLLMPDF